MSQTMPMPSKSQEENILRGARAIRPHLAVLVGPAAPDLDRRLAVLLEQAQTGKRVGDSIMNLLSPYPKALEFMNTYTELPGLPNPPPPGKCICPNCGHQEYSRSTASIPCCPNDGTQLICG